MFINNFPKGDTTWNREGIVFVYEVAEILHKESFI